MNKSTTGAFAAFALMTLGTSSLADESNSLTIKQASDMMASTTACLAMPNEITCTPEVMDKLNSRYCINSKHSENPQNNPLFVVCKPLKP